MYNFYLGHDIKLLAANVCGIISMIWNVCKKKNKIKCSIVLDSQMIVYVVCSVADPSLPLFGVFH